MLTNFYLIDRSFKCFKNSESNLQSFLKLKVYFRYMLKLQLQRIEILKPSSDFMKLITNNVDVVKYEDCSDVVLSQIRLQIIILFMEQLYKIFILLGAQ